jgi:hypothetical protein
VPTYKPQWTARAAAEQVYAAICKYGLTLEEFEGARYGRLPHMQKLMADGVLDKRFEYTRQSTAPVAA